MENLNNPNTPCVRKTNAASSKIWDYYTETNWNCDRHDIENIVCNLLSKISGLDITEMVRTAYKAKNADLLQSYENEKI